MDLAIASALLTASGQLELERPRRSAGDGRRAGPRRLGARRLRACWRSPRRRASAARRRSSSRPRTAPRRRSSAGIDVIPIESLAQLPALAGGEWTPERPGAAAAARSSADGGGPDLADLRGQRHLRYALEVAAAGGHSLLMVGPPGAGKSLAASRLPSILPPLARRGGARGGADRQRLRPARRGRAGRQAVPRAAPHDQPGGPGRRRQPAAARARRRWPTAASSSSTSSASFAATPWRRCGRRWRPAGSRSRGPAPGGGCPAASCWSPRPTPAPAGAARPTPSAAARRWRSSATRPGSAAPSPTASTSSPRSASPARRRSAVRRGSPRPRSATRVVAARERQERRLGAGSLQRRDDPGRGARVRARRASAAALLAESYSRRRLSGRAHDRVLRLARTVADLAGSEAIGREQMAQALQLRRRDQ